MSERYFRFLNNAQVQLGFEGDCSLKDYQFDHDSGGFEIVYVPLLDVNIYIPYPDKGAHTYVEQEGIDQILLRNMREAFNLSKKDSRQSQEVVLHPINESDLTPGLLAAFKRGCTQVASQEEQQGEVVADPKKQEQYQVEQKPALHDNQKSEEQEQKTERQTVELGHAAGPQQRDGVAAPKTEAGPLEPALSLKLLQFLPKELPGFERARVTPQQMALSTRENSAGLKAHRKKDYTASAQRFLAGAIADPGNPKVRYNYAAALALDEQYKASLAVLAQLKNQACSLCLGKVLKAAEDSDFAALKNEKDFVSLIRLARVQKLPSVLQATDELWVWLQAPKTDTLPSTLDSRTFVLFYEGKNNTPQRLKGSQSLVKLLKVFFKEEPRLLGVTNPQFTCANGCCTETTGSSKVKEICFDVQGEFALALKSLRLGQAD